MNRRHRTADQALPVFVAIGRGAARKDERRLVDHLDEAHGVAPGRDVEMPAGLARGEDCEGGGGDETGARRIDVVDDASSFCRFAAIAADGRWAFEAGGGLRSCGHEISPDISFDGPASLRDSAPVDSQCSQIL
jgi:hypothetical protein